MDEQTKEKDDLVRDSLSGDVMFNASLLKLISVMNRHLQGIRQELARGADALEKIYSGTLDVRVTRGED